MAGSDSYTSRVWLQACVHTDDGAGGYTDTFTDSTPLWANPYQTSMSERAYANQVGVSAQWTIRLYYDRLTKAIRQGDRIRYGDHILRVTSVQNMQERNEDVKLLAEEITPAVVDR